MPVRLFYNNPFVYSALNKWIITFAGIMITTDTALIISQTNKWITDVVVGCNFCPFAARELKQKQGSLPGRGCYRIEYLPGIISAGMQAAG